MLQTMLHRFGVLLIGSLVAGQASADVEVVSFTNATFGGAGYLTADPPPNGFLSFFSNNTFFSISFEFDRGQSVPVGPSPDQPPLLYDYYNITRVRVSFGTAVFEAIYPSAALGHSIGYRYPGWSGAQWSAGGLTAVSGQTVLGLVPQSIGFTSGMFPGSPDVFPSAAEFESNFIIADVGFRTPAGNNVSVFVQAIPEPSSLLLAIIGIAAILVRIQPQRAPQ